jgi:hypothetical protein
LSPAPGSTIYVAGDYIAGDQVQGDKIADNKTEHHVASVGILNIGTVNVAGDQIGVKSSPPNPDRTDSDSPCD